MLWEHEVAGSNPAAPTVIEPVRDRTAVSTSRSWGRACAVMPSRPTIVSAATSAFRIASSVASIVAQYRDVVASVRQRLHGVRPGRLRRLVVKIRPAPAVENASMMSPPELLPAPPTRPIPRLATLRQPTELVGEEGRVGRDDHDDDRLVCDLLLPIPGGRDVAGGGISSPTWAPSTISRSRPPWLAWTRAPTVHLVPGPRSPGPTSRSRP